MYTRPLLSSSRHSRRSALIASWRAARVVLRRGCGAMIFGSAMLQMLIAGLIGGWLCGRMRRVEQPAEADG